MTELAGWAEKPKMVNRCPLSRGEKVRMRESVTTDLKFALNSLYHCLTRNQYNPN
jgi:hypothetical protein